MLAGIVELLHAKKSGASWIALCPAHADKNPSLSISEKDGKILLHCHAGCTTANVLASAGLTFADLNGVAPASIVAEYAYVDENSNELFQCVRYEPKTFKQRHRGKSGEWIWNLDGVRRVLYRLPEVLAAEHVVLCEGEKDALAAASMGLVSTTNPMGAGKWRKEYSEFLRGKEVVIVPHNDGAKHGYGGEGAKHADEVAKALQYIAKSVRVCRLPDGIKDVHQYLVDLGLTKESFEDLIAKAPVWAESARAETAHLVGWSLDDLLAVEEKPVEFDVWPLLSPGLAVILDSLPKAGKTTLVLQGLFAALAGKAFLGRNTKPVRVVYVSEQTKASLAVQLREVGFRPETYSTDHVVLFTREIWSRFTWPEFLRWLDQDVVGDASYTALVVDTFYSVARVEDENDASIVAAAVNPLLDLCAKYGLAVLLTRHDRKSGGEVGVSGRGAIQLSGAVDVIAHLVRMPGAQATRRKLEVAGRIPCPPEQTIELMPSGEYFNWGTEAEESAREANALCAAIEADPRLSIRALSEKTGIQKDRVKKIAESRNYQQVAGGRWLKRTA
jgi:hypothetical protein